ncbi:MAG: SDR family NAD(P)-dependent oxidoreductase [Proteobacteria bacterium]|nr:MAG: SDR family NAD(P)-dependent oxidoreductase [Pseudomonadota bacterium]
MNTIQKPIDSVFNARTKAEEIMKSVDTNGKTVVITGGYAGIGWETTRQLSLNGARVLVGARDLKKAQAALQGMEGVQIFPLDLAKSQSIDTFASLISSKVSHVDILINNAGIMATPLSRDSRGFEMQFATNHLGHFQLTSQLGSLLKKNGGRVVTLTSAGHRFSPVNLEDPNFNTRLYDKWLAYGQSKSANSLFAVELDRRAKDFGVRAFAVHPGRILDTGLSRHMTKDELQAMLKAIETAGSSNQDYPTKTIEQGASTTLWCALSPQLADIGGVYCEDCNIAAVAPDDTTLPPGVKGWAVEQEAAQSLWKLSEDMLSHQFTF